MGPRVAAFAWCTALSAALVFGACTDELEHPGPGASSTSSGGDGDGGPDASVPLCLDGKPTSDYPPEPYEMSITSTVPKGLVVETTGATIEEVEMSFWQKARDLLVDPNLITLMLSIGLIGIVVELWNPGLVFPGTVGAISLILGLYGLQVLPVSLAGLLLMILAAGFFVAEAFVPTHGALTVAGGIMFVLGALILFDPAGEAYQVSVPVAVGIAAGLALLMGIALTRVVRVARNPAAVGVHGLVGDEGVVRSDGLVLVNGELWRAHAADDSPLVRGEHVRVEGVEDDLRLVVGSVSSPTSREGS